MFSAKTTLPLVVAAMFVAAPTQFAQTKTAMKADPAAAKAQATPAMKADDHGGHAHAQDAAAMTGDGRITLEEVQARMSAKKQVLIVDVRGKGASPAIKGAVHTSVAELDAWAKDVAKDTFIVAYCACGSEQSSLSAVKKLKELGFTNAYALKGGINAWTTAGLPTETVNAAE